MKEFYVYMLYDPDEELPFYIGKGYGDRIEKSIKSCGNNNYKKNIINKICSKNKKVEVELIGWSLSESEAFDLEIESIKYFGLRVNQDGCLVNMTLGGEGMLGYKHSNEAKKKISNSRKKIIGWNHTEETKKKIGDAQRGELNHMFGKSLSEEHLSKIRGRKHTEEEKLKMRQNSFLKGKTGNLHPKSTSVIIDNIEYGSMAEAATELKLGTTTIHRRVNSNKYYNYNYK